MRIALFLIYFSMLLFCGGTTTHAATMHPLQVNCIKSTLTKNPQIKFFHKDQDSDLIEDADTDTEDDCNFGANNKSNTDKNIAAVSTSSTQAWYHAFISLDLKTKVLTTQNQNAHFCGYSSPTFSRLQVLRI